MASKDGKTEDENSKNAINSAEAKEINLSILTTIKDSQSQHGLRHDDYMRYRQYCCRRLRRIRKSVKFLHGKTHYKKKKLDVRHIENERVLSIPLLNAERAWSYAMELKKALQKEDESRKQHHLLRRLKRAVKSSNELLELSRAVGNARTQVEAEVYASWMEGNEHIERSRWLEALASHVRSKTLCDRLARCSDLQSEERCKEIVQQLNVSIRLSTYNVKRKLKSEEKVKALKARSANIEEKLITKFLELEKEHKERESKSTSTVIVWNNTKIPVTNKHIQKALQKAAELESSGEPDSKAAETEGKDPKILALNGILAAYTKAGSQCQVDLLANEGAKLRTVILDRKATYLRNLKMYINFKKLGHKVVRSQLQAESLVEELSKQELPTKKKAKKKLLPDAIEKAIVSSLDRILEHLYSYKEVADQIKDKSSLREAEAAYIGYRALRCYYKALGFEKTGDTKSAFTLYCLCEDIKTKADRSMKNHVSKESEAKGKDLSFSMDILEARLASTTKDLKSRKYRSHALTVASDSVLQPSKSSLSLDKKGKALLERLKTYNAKSELPIAEFPVQVAATPSKPLFLDIAYHFVKFPSLNKRIESEQKKGGILSSFGLW
eukprot:CAMPEP_0167759566 /NCGR_PEP_ID=MMETSP0110_2-20121227/11097_1 /TAXON_ID=629695 /ORGANISM="Gymnochlora sp., Strain CCMP2014" /LENGTH=611 /DNA_ID=CAMNT_0007645971 /DNA_START=11 /DNA_END=1846 /DNA_ORIENTATION=+